RGHREKAICPTCTPKIEAMVDITYRYAPLSLDDGTEADNVLQGYCETCGNSVLVAAQSSYRTARAIEDRHAKRTRIRLSLELTDYIATQLGLAGLGHSESDEYFRALFQSIAGREEQWARVLAASKSPLLALPLTESEHLTLSGRMQELLQKLESLTGLESASELVRRMIILADANKEFGGEVASHLKASALVRS
ncbi:MAG TPA: hypothetical protein VGO93_12485, partial [Candidatus Xenobia bacterium]